jgi:hypothetical protein
MIALFRAHLTILGVTLWLVACGGNDPAPEPQPQPTATPSGPTVGELADRIANAWANVETYRAVFTTEGGRRKEGGNGNASPTVSRLPSSASSIQTVTEVIVPDRKRHVVRADGEVQTEFVVVDGRVYARGVQAPALPNATPAAGGWVVVDPATVEAGSPAGAMIADLARPAGPPYAGLSGAERGRTATPIGEENAGGRVCVAYRIADTTQTGERIEVTLALGPDDLPCFIETRAGGTINITTFVYNVGLAIEAPEG